MQYTLEKEFEETNFKGTLVVEVPSMLERLCAQRDAIIKGNELAPEKIADVEQAIKAVELVKQKTVSVDLVHVSGKKITTIEELMHFNECTQVIYKAAAIVMNGAPMGNG